MPFLGNNISKPFSLTSTNAHRRKRDLGLGFQDSRQIKTDRRGKRRETRSWPGVSNSLLRHKRSSSQRAREQRKFIFGELTDSLTTTVTKILFR
ncbi:hypothetical protein MRB53_032997 [Persea americana]|uniref:Uncharacterized protein n=1 Tax=Persea americana TaxID=3435 RepID=A0ACC2KUH7_PERAE|nr:hypothetical protein MRB53_032997 [Persea americana]